jgi:hypothetical protein
VPNDDDVLLNTAQFVEMKQQAVSDITTCNGKERLAQRYDERSYGLI